MTIMIKARVYTEYPDNILNWNMEKEDLDTFLERRVLNNYAIDFKIKKMTKKEYARWCKKLGI